ncbi:MAG: beta-ketoacyl-[acyl-carrier-protein] synthase family protein [Rhizonema sp. PD37]|nr:beta-ketoacyl-[acyl-carrier-protein] synthase family protein [Rhizonema sp. PD37]
MMTPKRVFITGIGIINPAGIGKDVFWRNITDGNSAIRNITRFNTMDHPVKIAGEITEFDPVDFIPRRLMIKSDRFTHYAIAATELALNDANINMEQEDPYRVGVWLGNNSGGWDIYEKGLYQLYRDGAAMINPWQACAWFPTAAQSYITIRYGIKGYSKSFVCDRASGASGLYFAIKSIQQGYNNVVFAGGTEAPITSFGMTCYYETGELSAATTPEGAYQPFAQKRTGVVLGEGSTILVLESEEHAIRRGAKIYGEVVSSCMTTDFNPTSGIQFERAMRKALKDADLTPTDIDVVLAEGCGTKVSDLVEARALKAVFEEAPNLLVTVPKSLYGHLYGASCITEVACSLLSMETGNLPTMQKIDELDPDCQLNFVTQPQKRPISRTMVNSRAREGVNVSFVISKYLQTTTNNNRANASCQ